MSKKPQKVSKKFGNLLGEYEENSKVVRVYQDGNQIYFVKGGKILPDMTMHTDDIDELLKMLDTVIKMKEEALEDDSED